MTSTIGAPGGRLGPPVVFAPLGVERGALRRSVDTTVVRSGYGPRRSARAVQAVGDGAPRPVLVAGLGGGLGAGIGPGDVIVATSVRSGEHSVPVPSAPLLGGALRRLGLTVHLGPLVTTPNVAHGAQRRELAATGALGVDMEAAHLAPAAAGGPFAALRVVVDTPDAPLARWDLAVRGVRALRTLTASGPAIDQWAAATATRELLLAGPRSFCAGVERAIEIVERSLDRYGAPVYVRRQIVHNAHVVRSLERRGAIFVDEVEQVPHNAVTVLAAHGVAPAVRESAARRSLKVVDATCPLVTKVHTETRRYAERGDTVLLIGHADHEEVVGTVGEAPGQVLVIADARAAESVDVPDPNRVAYVMQTTLSVDEGNAVAATLRDRFPALRGPRREDICYATSNRQAAVRAVAKASDLVLVIGSANSSNSLRLVETAQNAGTRAHLIDDATDVHLEWLTGAQRIGITAGASAPPHLVEELVSTLGGLGPTTVRDVDVTRETMRFTLPREVI